jgi:hypothetical protein
MFYRLNCLCFAIVGMISQLLVMWVIETACKLATRGIRSVATAAMLESSQRKILVSKTGFCILMGFEKRILQLQSLNGVMKEVGMVIHGVLLWDLRSTST